MNLSQHPRDTRTRRTLPPARLVWQTPENPPARLEILFEANTGQALAGSTRVCALPPGCGFVLDFGHELYGGVQIVTCATPGKLPAKVRIRFGESVSETFGSPDNDHAMHDLQVELPPMGSVEVGNTGFRFVRIDSLSDGLIELLGFRAISMLREEPQLGAFQSPDSRLNQIWQVGADTVQLCMQEYLWDGIKRDRLAWIGDLHPETQVVSAVWGEHPIVPATLDFVRDTTPLPGWMNGISSYSMWWILIHRDWYLRHGNLTYLKAQREYFVPLMRRMLEQADASGLERVEPWRFLDHPSANDPDALRAGLHALLLQTLEAGETLAGRLDEHEVASLCKETVRLMRRHQPALQPQCKGASALLAITGLREAGEVNREVLARDPLHGLSTFFGYYVLQGRAKAGDYCGALEVIRRYWGGMLDLGATSFWEHFELDWLENAGRIDELPSPATVDVHATYGSGCFTGHRHSLCHGWAAGPTAWLSEHVLGFRPLEPGSTTLLLDPHLGDLVWAEGAFPTGSGVVRVRHERRAGRVETQVEAPAGIEIVHPSDLNHEFTTC